MDNTQTQSYLSKFWNYTGSSDSDDMHKFIASNPSAGIGVGKMTNAFKAQKLASGGSVRGFAGGGAGGDYEAWLARTGQLSDSKGTSGKAKQRERERKALYNAAIATQTKPAKTAAQKAAEEQAKKNREAADKITSQALSDPSSLVKKAEVEKIDPNASGTVIGSNVGQATGSLGYDATTINNTNTVGQQPNINANTYQATQAADSVKGATDGMKESKGEVSDDSVPIAATQDPMTTDVLSQTASQGTANVMENPIQREIQEGELISGVADAEKAAKFTEQVQAVTAEPSKKATVQGQLEDLMADFEGGKTPAWAAGAMRAATGQMAARGLSASSMAGQATIQAAMESALPIASADAATQANFEKQNLSNRQQSAILAAQQRAQFIGMEFTQDFQARVANSAKIGEVANMNFTAEQSIALENSRAANTMNLANLSNSQAMTMAQASAIANLETSNLSNQQQAAVQKAQAFLGMDMQNLSNQQQMNMFKSQSLVQSLLTDQAADNASKQFNATSQNQTDQFMSSLRTQIDQYNASALNATNQYNAGAKNAASQYNAGLREQRNQFNATNRLTVAQANATWRQNVATINTAQQNEANREFAKQTNGITNKALDEIWQRERDIMSFAHEGDQKRQDRVLSLMLADKDLESVRSQLEFKENEGKSEFLLNAFDKVSSFF